MGAAWQNRQNPHALAVYDGSNTLIIRFEYADGRMPVAMTMNDSSVYYLTYDQVGSLRIVTDISGTVVRRFDYDSFGNAILPGNNPTPEIPFGFAGGLHDRNTGLVRFGYRDYDPDAGRWTAKDPLGFAGGDTDMYGYCLNDSVNLFDSLGLESRGERIARQIQWYMSVSGIGGGTGEIITINNNISPCFAKCTAAVIGVAVGSVSGTGPGVITYWIADSLLEGHISDPKTGIEWINPPDAGTNSEDLYSDYYNNPNPFFTPFYIRINICD